MTRFYIDHLTLSHISPPHRDNYVNHLCKRYSINCDQFSLIKSDNSLLGTSQHSQLSGHLEPSMSRSDLVTTSFFSWNSQSSSKHFLPGNIFQSRFQSVRLSNSFSKLLPFLWCIKKHVANVSINWCKNQHKQLCKTISQRCNWIQLVNHEAMTQTKYNQEWTCSTWFSRYLPESGRELRSAHNTSGMALVSPETEDSLRLRVALSTMFFTSDRNIMVWTSFTSEYSGSQCMWALATSSSCFSMPWSDFPAKGVMWGSGVGMMLKVRTGAEGADDLRWVLGLGGMYSQETSIISFRTSSRTATPMLSLVITRLSMASEPSEFAMASWLNSTVCFCTALNLHRHTWEGESASVASESSSKKFLVGVQINV